MCCVCAGAGAHIEPAAWVGDECGRSRHPSRGETGHVEAGIGHEPKMDRDSYRRLHRNMGAQRDCERLVQSLHMRAARASADRGASLTHLLYQMTNDEQYNGRRMGQACDAKRSPEGREAVCQDASKQGFEEGQT